MTSIESDNSRDIVEAFARTALACASLTTLHWVSLTFFPGWTTFHKAFHPVYMAIIWSVEVYLFLFSVSLWFGAYGVNYRPVTGETEESVINYSGISALMVSAIAGVMGAFSGLMRRHILDTSSTVDWVVPHAMLMQYGHYSSEGKGSDVRDLVFSVFTCNVWSVLSCALFATFFTDTISTGWVRWIVVLVCALGFPAVLGAWTGICVAVAKHLATCLNWGSNGATKACELAITVHAHSALLLSMICGYLAYLLERNPSLDRLFVDDVEYDSVKNTVLYSLIGAYAGIVLLHCILVEKLREKGYARVPTSFSI